MISAKQAKELTDDRELVIIENYIKKMASFGSYSTVIREGMDHLFAEQKDFYDAVSNNADYLRNLGYKVEFTRRDLGIKKLSTLTVEWI